MTALLGRAIALADSRPVVCVTADSQKVPVVLGLIGLLTFGLFGVGAMIGLVLGGIAIWKATKQPAEYGGRGIAVGGVIANAVGGAMGMFLAVLIVAGHSTPKEPPAPGETAFQVASSRIFIFHGETAFGNTPDAKALAERHSRIMASLSEVMFTGGPSKGRPSLSDDKFLTYCERRPGRICFLVHVPALRSYQGEARSTLLKIAWTAAREVTKEARTPADLKLAVGLRGAVAYGATAMGMGEGTPVNAIAEILDEKPDGVLPSTRVGRPRRRGPSEGDSGEHAVRDETIVRMTAHRSLSRTIRNKFIAGLVIVIPIVITVKALWWLFT